MTPSVRTDPVYERALQAALLDPTLTTDEAKCQARAVASLGRGEEPALHVRQPRPQQLLGQAADGVVPLSKVPGAVGNVDVSTPCGADANFPYAVRCRSSPGA